MKPRTLKSAAVVLGCIVLCCWPGGCKPAEPRNGVYEQGDDEWASPLGGAKAINGTVKQDIEKAKPYTKKAGVVHLNSAQSSLVTQADLLATVGKAVDAAVAKQRAGWAKTVAERDVLAHELRVEKDHWLGFKTRAAIKWVLIIGIGGWITLGALGVFLPGMGGRWILNLLPFANPFTFFARKYWSPPPALDEQITAPPVLAPEPVAEPVAGTITTANGMLSDVQVQQLVDAIHARVIIPAAAVT